MVDYSNTKRAAMLWFVAAGASLAAALITLSDEGQVKWALLAAATLMAALGWRTLRRSNSTGV